MPEIPWPAFMASQKSARCGGHRSYSPPNYAGRQHHDGFQSAQVAPNEPVLERNCTSPTAASVPRRSALAPRPSSAPSISRHETGTAVCRALPAPGTHRRPVFWLRTVGAGASAKVRRPRPAPLPAASSIALRMRTPLARIPGCAFLRGRRSTHVGTSAPTLVARCRGRKAGREKSSSPRLSSQAAHLRAGWPGPPL